ncbi:transglycosylase SLT domain-containing protein [Nocardia wallacei]|uniref:transglycosylase SLT domain-containing protein n=1 Tax=Nocardia wallacei TaxID=480035 RepID=UPI002453F927|nr:transglycosylase SLT domain-containing protein [Nocardia wallacei]
MNKLLKALGDGTADTITIQKLDDLDQAEDITGEMATQLNQDQSKKQDYLTRLNDLDTNIADIAKKSAGVSNTAVSEVEELGTEVQGILDAVPDKPDLPRQFLAISAIDKAVGDSEQSVTNAHQWLTEQSVNIPGYDGPGSGPVSTPRVPHNNSGSYDSSYTDRVSSVSGSTARNVLSEEQVRAHIKEALKALGITDPVAIQNWTEGYMTLIKRESGFNAGAKNLHDSNAAAGHPSQGLTQTIPSTFEAYHVAGTSNVITDPTANIAASMNYVMHRYDVSRDGSNLAANVQQANPNASPKGY